MEWMSDPQAWIALATLTALEIVLGIDNIIFISILSGKLPQERRATARTTGLALAMITRILLLASLAWLSHLSAELFQVAGRAVTARDLILALDHDGERVTRAAVNGLRISQSWHEVTIDGLEIKEGRLTGTATILLHGDRWVELRDGGGAIAGKLTIDAGGEGEPITGSYRIQWGVSFKAKGAISGRIRGR